MNVCQFVYLINIETELIQWKWILEEYHHITLDSAITDFNVFA